MEDKKQNPITEENLPKPKSMKKANRKMIVLLCVIFIFILIACNVNIFVGDLREKVFLFSSLCAVVFAIVYFVKVRKNRVK
jgi:uncharacterized membrane protein